jgi:hypothetical protein
VGLDRTRFVGEVLSAAKTCDECAKHAAVKEMKASVRKLLLRIAKVSVSK